MKLKFLAICCITLGIVSCSDDDNESENETPSNFSVENEQRSAQMSTSSDLSFSVVENSFDEQTAPSELVSSTTFFPTCATITLNGNGDGSGTITVDFGEGCTLNDGNYVQGAIIIDYETVDENTRNLTYTYEDYAVNLIEITGGGTAVRTLSNNNGLPQSVATESISASFPNTDVTGTRVAHRTVVWVEGVGSGTWTDNVYEVSGNWDTELSNGFSRSGNVTTVLRRELSCPVVVSGVVEITQNIGTASLDYGDGTCDSIAVLTFNGVDYEIYIGN